MDSLRICFASSEVAPFAKTGGLADVSASLPRELSRLGCDVRVFTPLYRQRDSTKLELEVLPSLTDIPVEMAGRHYFFSVAKAAMAEDGPDIYFIDCPTLFHRGGVYTSDGDEHVRFLFFTRAVLESCQRLSWGPDVFHLNDWQTAMLPLYLKTLYAWDQLFADSKTLLTLHNVGYQGVFGSDAIGDAGLGQDTHLFHHADLDDGYVSFLRTGILYANALTTVSPTYALEIQTEKYGMGLQDLLFARRASLFGILNGVDYEVWSPELDEHIEHTYSEETLDQKELNKQHLLRKVGLPYREGVAVAGIVSRMASQKGLDHCFEALPPLLRAGKLMLVVLGSGEPRIEQGFGKLHRAFPHQVSFYRGFHNGLAHMIEAGADMFLMPSRYEPCGLNQMYSLRYGTVPVVRNTGGLADAVEQWNPRTGDGTGFLFDHYTASGLQWAVRHAIETYEDSAAWRQLMTNGMSQDFSWHAQAPKYISLYGRLVAG